MKKIKLLVLAAISVLTLSSLNFSVVMAAQDDNTNVNGGGTSQGSSTNVPGITDICTSNPNAQVCKKSSVTVESLFVKVTDTLLFIIGALSVVMIIVGGFKYITSSGDPSKVGSAKNTILYAVIGLVLSLLAYAIVQFVVGRIAVK